MTRKAPTKRVDPAQSSKYYAKAVRFHADARTAVTLGSADFSPNSVSALCVLAAIAYADAVTIRATGEKSRSSDHSDVVRFVGSLLPRHTDMDRKALKALAAVVRRKDDVSYGDDLEDELSAQQMLDRLETFAAWARRQYDTYSRGS